MIKIVFYISCFAMGVGLLFHIIGLAVPSWSVSNSDSSVAIGLWEQCTPDDCESYDSASVRPIRALVMLAMFLGFLGLVVFCWMILCRFNDFPCCNFCTAFDSSGKKRLWVALAATSASMLFTIIGVIIWSTSIHEDLYDYHIGAGYGLCLFGGICIGLGGLGACITGLKISHNLSQVDSNSPSHHLTPTAPPTQYSTSDPPPPYPSY